MPGATSLAVAIVALVAVAPFVAIAVINTVDASNADRRELSEALSLSGRGALGLFGALVGHIFWSFGDNPAKDPAPLRLVFTGLGSAVLLGLVGGVSLAVVGFGLRLVSTLFRRK